MLRINGTLNIGHGPTSQDSIQFSLSPERDKESGVVKLFLSTSYVDMKGLEQEGLHRAAKPRGGARKVRIASNSGWTSPVCVLTYKSRDV